MTYLGTANSGEFLVATADNALTRFGEIRGDASGLLESISVQKIQGFPVDSAAPGSGEFLSYDGSQWTSVASAASNHNLLSSTHLDTTPDGVTRGALVYGSGASPAWSRLPLGTAEFVLYSDGTDVGYTRLGANTPFELGSAGAPSHTFTGDLDTGASAATADSYVISASGQAIITAESRDAGQIVKLDGGQVVRTRTLAINGTMDADDYILLLTATNLTVTLSSGVVSGQKIIIKDRDGLAGSGPTQRHTIDGNGANIDGNSSILITNAYGAFTLLYNGASWNII